MTNNTINFPWYSFTCFDNNVLNIIWCKVIQFSDQHTLADGERNADMGFQWINKNYQSRLD